MDIRLLVHRFPRLSPDLFPEEQEGMRKRCGDRCERQSVRNCKGRRNKKRTVGFVGLFIKGRVVIKDLADVVGLAKIIEGSTRGDSVMTKIE